jgi:phenylacetic acid degradation operon negative regulatory protein
MTDDNALTAAELILALMDSAANPELKSRYFVAAGMLFAIDPRTMRVALTRLVKNGVLVQMHRGLYGLGPRGGELHTTVRNWATVEDNLTTWNGGWIAVYLGHLRRNKADVRQRERALRLLGLAPADANLWIRPANLKSSLNEVRERLLGLGLSTAAMVVALEDLLPKNAIRVDQLWDIATLEQRYRTRITELADSQHDAATLTLEDRARKTLLLGRAVTRDILIDPLLPKQMLDTDLRRRMIKAMRDYDRLGKACWREYYAANG